MLAAAVRALGDHPLERDRAMIWGALMRGPEDLAAELRLAAAGDSPAWRRLAAVVTERGVSPYMLLDLLTDADSVPPRGRVWPGPGVRAVRGD